MPFPLHKTPVGLLELFRLRTLGAAPPQFGDQVVPVADISRNYGADLAVVGTSGTGPAALPLNVSTVATIPARITQFAGRVTLGAAGGTQLRITVLWRPRQTDPFIPVGFLLVTAPVAAGTYTCISQLTEPILHRPVAKQSLGGRLEALHNLRHDPFPLFFVIAGRAARRDRGVRAQVPP